MSEIDRSEQPLTAEAKGPMLAGKRLLRLFTDPAYVARVARFTLGLATPVRTEDRRVLEQVIFRHYASRDDVHTVLFVGCQWYTRHYEKTFFPQQEFWTIEPSPSAKRYGGSHHVVAPLERLADFFPENAFDLIICNGVYGWGLNSHAQCEAAFAQCHSRLRPGGHFVFGWNDVPAFTPVPLDSIASLSLFRRVVFPELGVSRFVTQTELRHVFDFYCK